MYKRILIVLLCLVMSFTLPFTASASKTLTAVNDRFLPYSSGSSPVYKNGEYYVPYSIFSNFGVSSSYSSDTQMLTMSSGGTTLTFGVSQGTAYDQNGNSYAYPPYAINGTVYVPVRLVCGRFGLMFSVINADATVLRICSDSARYNDAAFLSANADYIAGLSGTDGGDNPSYTTKPNEPEEPKEYAPEGLSLSYLAPTSSSELSSLLDQLDTVDRPATFFLPTDLSAFDGAVLRRLVGSGYAVGFMLQEGEIAPLSQLQGANATLWTQTGTQSRLFYAPFDMAEVPPGYVAYTPTHATSDRTAYQEMDALRKEFVQSEEPVAVLLGVNSQTAELTALLLQYVRTEGCKVNTVNVFRPQVEL